MAWVEALPASPLAPVAGAGLAGLGSVDPVEAHALAGDGEGVAVDDAGGTGKNLGCGGTGESKQGGQGRSQGSVEGD